MDSEVFSCRWHALAVWPSPRPFPLWLSASSPIIERAEVLIFQA